MNQLTFLRTAPDLVAHALSMGWAHRPPPEQKLAVEHKLDPYDFAVCERVIARACVLGGMTTAQLMGKKTKAQNTDHSKLKQLAVTAIRRRIGASYINIGIIFGMSPGGVQTCEKYGARFADENPTDAVWKELMKA